MSDLDSAIQRLRDHVLCPKPYHQLAYDLGGDRNLGSDIAMVVAQATNAIALANGYAEQQADIELLRANQITSETIREIKHLHAEIERLLGERDECRRLLRSALRTNCCREVMGSKDFEAARAAGGDS